MSKRPSKPVLLAILVIAALGVFLFINSTHPRATPGEVIFHESRPTKGATLRSAIPASEYHSTKSTGWLSRTWEGIANWELNPWKRKDPTFGSRYFALLNSDDPEEQRQAEALRALGEDLRQRVLERYPELKFDLREVPPEDNGFLALVEFVERLKAESQPTTINLSAELKKYLRQSGPWNPAAAAAWVTEHQATLDGLRRIGRLPDQSMAGIDPRRWMDELGGIHLEMVDALLLDARLAVQSGNVQHAMESVQAANGLATHLGGIEGPPLIYVLIQSANQSRIQDYVISDLLPAIPSESRDLAAWEQVVPTNPSAPSLLTDAIRGEWNAISGEYIFPVLMDAAEPDYPSDPDALIDLHASFTADVLSSLDQTEMAGWTKLPDNQVPNTQHLSRQSRQILAMTALHLERLSANLRRSQVKTAMTQAAFAIMQDQLIPPEPIMGLPFQWNPSTRELSLPNDPFFEEMELDPITVPIP